MNSSPTIELVNDDVPLDTTRGIEAHGIDHIPESERSGHPKQLFGVWAASQINYLGLIVGATLVLMGLSFWQALIALVIGSAFGLLPGLISASGSASGTPSEIVMRALFGIRGNRINQFFSGWLVNVLYLALNWSAAGYIAFSLLRRMGLPLNSFGEAVVVVIIAALTLVVSVYGYNLITRLYQPLCWILVAVFALAAAFVLLGSSWHFAEAKPLDGVQFWATLVSGITLIASAPLSYTNAADFARYLPSSTTVRQTAMWVALGFLVPGILIGALGAFVATSFATSDPQSALEQLLPAWFTPIFTLAVVFGTIANNAMTAYSSGLVLQTIGVKLRRSVTVLIDGAVGITITLFALLVWNFLDAVSNLLQLIVVVTAPLMAIYIADVRLRKNRYDGTLLEDDSQHSVFWFNAGYNLAGVTSYLLGMALALCCISTSIFVGPISAWMGGFDLSLTVGLIVPFFLYTALMKRYSAAQRTLS